MEKRLPITIVVNLAQVNGHASTVKEIAYTDNISAHGVCVISNRPWKPGELVEVTPMKEQITIRGKVAHCERRGEDRYAIGLTFRGGQVNWSPYRTYAGAA